MDYLYDVAYPAYNDLEAIDRDAMMATFNIMCGNIDYNCAIAAQTYSLIMYGIEPSDQGKSFFQLTWLKRLLVHGPESERSKKLEFDGLWQSQRPKVDGLKINKFMAG